MRKAEPQTSHPIHRIYIFKKSQVTRCTTELGKHQTLSVVKTFYVPALIKPCSITDSKLESPLAPE